MDQDISGIGHHSKSLWEVCLGQGRRHGVQVYYRGKNWREKNAGSKADGKENKGAEAVENQVLGKQRYDENYRRARKSEQFV